MTLANTFSMLWTIEMDSQMMHSQLRSKLLSYAYCVSVFLFYCKAL